MRSKVIDCCNLSLKYPVIFTLLLFNHVSDICFCYLPLSHSSFSLSPLLTHIYFLSINFHFFKCWHLCSLSQSPEAVNCRGQHAPFCCGAPTSIVQKKFSQIKAQNSQGEIPEEGRTDSIG